jgi:hypothetical protein
VLLPAGREAGSWTMMTMTALTRTTKAKTVTTAAKTAD